MEQVRLQRRRMDAPRDPSDVPSPSRPAILALQESAGNRAVAQMLQRAVFVPGKKNKKTRLKNRGDVEHHVFNVGGKDLSTALAKLLEDRDGAAALDEFLENTKDEITLDGEGDCKKLIARITEDAAKVRDRRERAEREKQEKKQEKEEKEPAAALGKLEKHDEPEEKGSTATHGLVSGLFALCKPLFDTKSSAKSPQSAAIKKELDQLKQMVKKLTRVQCLEMFGHLGNLEISEGCKKAGAGDKLKQLEGALRRAVTGDDPSSDKFVYEQLQRSFKWLTFEQFLTIYEQRAGKHGAKTTSARITPTVLMRKFGEIIACADLINEIDKTGSKCLTALQLPCRPNQLGFTLLHKVAAGNIRRFKIVTIDRCIKQLEILCPLALAHQRVLTGAKKGICLSIEKVITQMNSKHLLRDVRQLGMLLGYLDAHQEALCLQYSLGGKGWELDMVMQEDDREFVLEVEGLPGAKKTPEVIVEYLAARHAKKQQEAQKGLGGSPTVRLAVPADLPREALAALDGKIAISGALKDYAPLVPEAEGIEDEDEEEGESEGGDEFENDDELEDGDEDESKI